MLLKRKMLLFFVLIFQIAYSQSLYTKIPFDDSSYGGLITIKAFVNNTPLTLGIDNGSSPSHIMSIFTPSAYKLGIIDSNKKLLYEIIRIDETELDVKLGDGFQFKTKKIRISDLRGLNNIKLPDGVITQGILRKYVLEVDYKDKFLVFHDTTFRNKIPKDFQYIPLYFNKGPMHFFNATFYYKGKQITEKVGIDLGFIGGDFYWNPSMVKKYDNILANSSKEQQKFVSMEGVESLTKIVIDSVIINGWTIQNVNSFLSAPAKSVYHYSYISVGNQILRLAQKVYYDFNNNKMYLPKSLFH